MLDILFGASQGRGLSGAHQRRSRKRRGITDILFGDLGEETYGATRLLLGD